MFKKICLISSLLITTSSNLAFANGFYLGGGVGINNLKDNASLTNQLYPVQNGNASLGATSALGEVYAGYQFNFTNKVNLGLESFIDLTSTKATVTSTLGTASLKEKYAYGLRVIPGYQFTNETDFHAIVGVVRGHFTLSDNGYLANVPSDNFNAYGYQIGLGSTTHLNKNLSLRGDVIYSGYQRNTYTPSIGNNTYGYKNKISTTAGVLSLSYNFG